MPIDLGLALVLTPMGIVIYAYKIVFDLNVGSSGRCGAQDCAEASRFCKFFVISDAAFRGFLGRIQICWHNDNPAKKQMESQKLTA